MPEALSVLGFMTTEHLAMSVAVALSVAGLALVGGYRSHRAVLRALSADHARLTSQLRADEADMRRVIDSTSEGFWLIGADDLRIRDVNEALCRMLGYERAELIGRPLLDLFAEDARDAMRERMSQVLTTAQRKYETTMLTRSGARVPVLVSATTLVDAPGRSPRAFAFVRDHTAAREAAQALARQQALLRSVIDSIPDLIFYKDTESIYLGGNAAFAKRAGRPEEAIVGCTDHDLFTAEEAVFYREKDREMLASGQPLRFEEVVRLPNGSRQYFDTLKTPYHGPDGEVLGVLGICRDITLRRRAQDGLRLASIVFDCTSEAIMVTDPENRIVTVNPAFTRLTGYTKEEVRGRNPSLLKSGRHDAEFYRELWRSLAESGSWEGEIWNRRKNGEIYPEWLSLTEVRSGEGFIEQYVAVFMDITGQKQREELIVRQASFDGLTGLPNRALFGDRLGQAIAAAARAGEGVAVLFLDLDRFKSVNDTLGHAAGDLLLQEVARRIQGCVREVDTVARLGGDEFTLILPNVESARAAELVAQKVLAQLAEPFLLVGQQAFVTGSVGIALYPADGTTIEALLTNADRAMYKAKEVGRNGFLFFRSE